MKKLYRIGIVLLFVFVFFTIPSRVDKALATGGCDIRSVIFNPSGVQNKQTWFSRSNPPSFGIKIIGNGKCAGQTIQGRLANVAGINKAIWPDATGAGGTPTNTSLTFNPGSNEIDLTFQSGEYACTILTYGLNCDIQMHLVTEFGDFYSDSISGAQGSLKYYCDPRATTCDNTYKFKFLGMTGGQVGGATNTICAYVAPDGNYACINNSNSDASGNRCSSNSGCTGKDCKPIASTLCGSRATIYGCIVHDTQQNADIYACSKTNSPTCSDVSCGSSSCGVISPATLCGTTVGAGGGGGSGCGTPGQPACKPGETQKYSFEITNPLKGGASDFTSLVKIIAQWIFNLAIPIAVAMIVYSGILFLTSAGDTSKITKAREVLTYAVVGLAIILIGSGFITLIQSILELGGQGTTQNLNQNPELPIVGPQQPITTTNGAKGNKCSKDNNCSSGLKCKNTICQRQTGNLVGEPCNGGASCDIGLACDTSEGGIQIIDGQTLGTCFETSVGGSRIGDICQKDKDCISGLKCNQICQRKEGNLNGEVCLKTSNPSNCQSTACSTLGTALDGVCVNYPGN